MKRENKQRQEAERRRYFVSGCKDQFDTVKKKKKKKFFKKKENVKQNFCSSSLTNEFV